MIIECSVNFQSDSLACAASNECIHQWPMQAAVAPTHRLPTKSRKPGRLINSDVRITNTRRLMSLLAKISKILIIAYTITASSAGPSIAATASATASAAMVTWPPTFFHSDQIQCPSLADIPTCPCYKFDDGNYQFSKEINLMYVFDFNLIYVFF